MKKNTLLTLICVSITHLASAQVLYSENFDNLTVGNVSTDLTGQTSGQGNWHTIYDSSSPNATLNWFQIQTETNKDKVITLQSPAPPIFGNTALQQRNIDQLINNRTQGNDVIKFEVDFYTGSQHNDSPFDYVSFGFYDNNNANLASANLIAHFIFISTTGEFYGAVNNGNSSMVWTEKVPLGKNFKELFLPFDTWVKCIFYADYTNKKIYYELPSLNVVIVHDFLKYDADPNRFNKFIPKSIMMFSDNKQTASINKFDNFKITALKNVPLNVSAFFNEKFNIFPNPATDIVNITNTDNIDVEQIDLYDLSGKKIKEERFNADDNIQLNIENLQSGIYLLQLQTNLGSAVKKLIKK